MSQGADFEADVGRPLTPDDTVLYPTPMVGWLTDTADASIHAAQEVWDDGAFEGEFTLRVSHLEAPSCRLALAMMSGSTRPADAAYDTGKVAEPDIREPWAPVPFVLWEYEGRVPRQALPPPEPRIREAVLALANTREYLPRWWHHARTFGPTLGPDATESLCAAMVHPSPQPEQPPWRALRRQQAAAAMLLANVDDGWAGSARGRALSALVRGPLDWVVDVAVLAMVELALDEPDHLPAIRNEIELLWEHMPREGHVCWAGGVAKLYLRLPGTSKHFVDQCEAWLAES